MDIVRRLAVSQARGWRQASFINELLSFGPVPFREVPVPGGTTVRYGVSDLEYRSWVGLRSRLTLAGFVVETNQSMRTVRLHFPESPQ